MRPLIASRGWLAAAWLTIVLPLGLAAGPASAADLTVEGIKPTAFTLSVTELEALGLSEIEEGRDIVVDGQTRRNATRWSGVRLSRLLESAGIEALDRGRVRTGTVLVIASDGYRALFSWGEIFNNPAGQSIILATRMNGEPVPGRFGPVYVMSLSDSRPSRNVRNTVRIRFVPGT